MCDFPQKIGKTINLPEQLRLERQKKTMNTSLAVQFMLLVADMMKNKNNLKIYFEKQIVSKHV
jgi:hypothetical protein